LVQHGLALSAAVTFPAMVVSVYFVRMGNAELPKLVARCRCGFVAQAIYVITRFFQSQADTEKPSIGIPLLEARGAAYATLASQWGVVLSTMLFPRSRRTGVAIL